MLQQGLTPTLSNVRAPGSGGGPQADPATDLAPWQPSGSDTWDRAKAAHLMRRAGFGATPEEADAIVALGMDRTVDFLLTAPTTGLQEYGTQILPSGEILNLNFTATAQRAQLLYEAASSPYPLREKMTLFFLDHFSVGSENINDLPLKIPHSNIFRRHGLGSFRQMLVEVTRDPAMLLWLDNYINGQPVSGVPKINENYAREIQELYTIGVTGGYTQNDVVEAAKCLSGWGLNGLNQFIYRSTWHVNGPKTFSAIYGNKVINSGGQQEAFDLIDMLLVANPTAEYLVTKIWEFFVSEKPYPALVTMLANRFRQDGNNFRSLMNIILRSNFFYSSAARRQLVKNPVEFTVGAIRSTSTPIGNYKQVSTLVQAMGWALFGYGNPAGLPDGIAWISTQSVIARANYAAELTQVSNGAGNANSIQPVFDPFREVVTKNLTTAEAIVDHYLKILVDDDVPFAVRLNLYDFMNRSDKGLDPFVLTSAKVNEKVRGLVHLIMSLPEFQMN